MKGNRKSMGNKKNIGSRKSRGSKKSNIFNGGINNNIQK